MFTTLERTGNRGQLTLIIAQKGEASCWVLVLLVFCQEFVRVLQDHHFYEDKFKEIYQSEQSKFGDRRNVTL